MICSFAGILSCIGAVTFDSAAGYGLRKTNGQLPVEWIYGFLPLQLLFRISSDVPAMLAEEG